MALARSISSRKMTNAARMVMSAAIRAATAGVAGLPVVDEKAANHSAELLSVLALSTPRSTSRRPFSQSARSTRYWTTSGPTPPTRPATGTSARTALARPSGLPLAASSIRARIRVAAATTAARASIRLYFWTHQPTDRSGRVGAVTSSSSRSRNQFAPSVKNTVNTFMTPPPAVRVAPLSRSPGLGMQPMRPPGPLAHGGTGPRGGTGWGMAAGRGASTRNQVRAASCTLAGRGIVELLEALCRIDQLADGAGCGLPLHRHRPRCRDRPDQLPVPGPPQPQGRGRPERLGRQATVVAVDHHRPQNHLGVGRRVTVDPVAEQVRAQDRTHAEAGQAGPERPSGDPGRHLILRSLQPRQGLGDGHGRECLPASVRVAQEPQRGQDPRVPGGGADRTLLGLRPAHRHARYPPGGCPTDSGGINHHGGPIEGIDRRHRRARPAPRPDHESASDHGNRQGGDQPTPLWAPRWPRAGP